MGSLTFAAPLQWPVISAPSTQASTTHIFKRDCKNLILMRAAICAVRCKTVISLLLNYSCFKCSENCCSWLSAAVWCFQLPKSPVFYCVCGLKGVTYREMYLSGNSQGWSGWNYPGLIHCFRACSCFMAVQVDELRSLLLCNRES